jgi:hypothetical protein
MLYLWFATIKLWSLSIQIDSIFAPHLYQTHNNSKVRIIQVKNRIRQALWEVKLKVSELESTPLMAMRDDLYFEFLPFE